MTACRLHAEGCFVGLGYFYYGEFCGFSHSTLTLMERSTPQLIVAREVETFPVNYLANSSLSPGGYILTQIPIIDGLRRSTDYDDDLGYGRTYDEFGDEYDISTVGPTPLNRQNARCDNSCSRSTSTVTRTLSIAPPRSQRATS